LNCQRRKKEKAIWIVEYLGLNQVALKSEVAGSYLSGDCDVLLSGIKTEKEIWRVQNIKGLYTFVNYKGKFLRGGLLRKVDLDNKIDDNEKFVVELCF